MISLGFSSCLQNAQRMLLRESEADTAHPSHKAEMSLFPGLDPPLLLTSGPPVIIINILNGNIRLETKALGDLKMLTPYLKYSRTTDDAYMIPGNSEKLSEAQGHPRSSNAPLEYQRMFICSSALRTNCPQPSPF